MRSIGLLLFASIFGFITVTNAQNGSAAQPFTSLGQAQNVASDGVYYFSLSGTNFSTYVRVGGWVQVAVDFGDGVGNLPQSNALNNTVRGILTPTALSKLGSATVTRVLTSNGQLDVQNNMPGIITRIVNNQTLLATPADNTDNGGNWTGTNTLAAQFTNAGNTQAYGLNLNIFHAGNNGEGIHWIPFYNQQMIKFSAGDIPNGAYFQLLVRAPMVAVVSGPVINIQPSTSAQSVCLNAAINALSVSATSPNGSGITYQWYSNASASNAGGTSIGGATSSSYTPPNNVVGTVYYYVICTNNQASSTSNVSAGITVNAIPQAAANSGSVDYLVVGGGGGGGFDGAGGGGGGQVKTGSISLASGSYAVTIGNGGANATGFGAQAGNGGSTTLSLPTPIVSIGGGGGGSKGANGATGGNGGGGGHSNYAGAAGAAGGFAGGNANGDGGGGGGGAGTAGATGSAGRNGGDGVLSSISGSATYYGGGGGGGSYGSTGPALGGLGGGGRGGLAYTPLAVAGTPNTGGGGGGAGEAQSNPGRSGGSGVVIVRYLGSPSGTGGIITQSGGYTIHTFNSNGTFAYNGSSSAVVPNVTVCGSTTATFTSTLAAGLTLDWYNAASGGTLLSQGTSTYTTPVLASTTTYYVAVRNVSAGCVSATRTAVTATVNTTSFTSTTGASLCSTGTATLQAATAAGTINWYAASTGGASLGTGTSYTTPSIAATTTYYAEVTNNGCTTNPRVAVVASVNSTPPTPTITQSGCGVLSLGNYGGGNALDFGQFNSSSFITIPSSLNSVFNTNNVTLEGWFKFDPNNVGFPMLIGEAFVSDGKITFCMHKQGNTIIAGFYNNGWTAVTSASTIQYNTWMHIAATYDQTSIKIYINGNLDATLNVNAALPTGSESWYIGRRWDHNDYFRGVMDEIRIWNVARTQAQIQASMNTTVPTNATGLRAYYKLDESAGTSPADATGNGYNGTLTNGSIWQVPSTSILGASQATYLWSPGGQTTNTITAATSGTYSVVATLSGCQSASASSSVVLGVTASSNQTICSGTSPANLTLTGTAATIQWQSSTDNVNFTNIGGATSATLSSAQMGNLNATTYYRAYATSAVCAPSYSNTVTITVNTNPSFTSTTGASRCGTGTVTLQAATAAGTINWYAALTGGASLGTGTSFNTPSIAATTTYYAAVTNNGCTSSPRTAVVATVNAIPTFSSTTGATICGTGTGTLQAATAAGTINWYAALTGGVSLGTGTSYTTPSIATTTTYYADVTNNGCTSSPRTSVVATVNSLPQAASITGTSVDYLVVGGGGGGGQEGGGGGGGGQVKTGSVSFLNGSFAVTIGNGGAGATTISSQASNGGTTTLSLPTPVVSIGGGGGGSKNAQGASGGNGGGGGHPGFSGGAGAAGGFAGGTANNEIGGGGAGAGAVGTSASNSNGGIGVSSSISGSATFYGGGGGGGSWQVGIGPGQGGQGGGGSGGTALSPLATSGAANTGGGGGGSGNSQSTPVAKNGGSGIVIVRYLGSPSGTGGTITQSGGYTIHTFNSNGTFAFNNPSTAVVPNVTICGSTSATFTGTVAAGFTLDWYDAASGGNLLSQGTLTYTTPALASTTIYYVAVRNVSTGCVSATRTAVTATVNATSFTSTTGASRCGTGTVTLQAATAAGTINWYAASTGGASLGAGTSFTTPSIAATTTYYVQVTNNGCTTNPRVAVVATVNATPPTPTITQSGCGVLTLGNYGSGNALNLGTNNTSKYVSIPASLNASFNTNNITVEGWFNLSAYDPAMPEPMLVGEAYLSDNKVTFMLSRYQNQIRAGYFSGSAWSLALSASSIPANTWTHIAATYDQTSIKIYINGVLDGTLNTSSPLPTGNEVWYLGKRFAGPDMISGVMDEIRIWNVARTQAQIQAVMNTSVPTNSTGLRAYYKLDESAGTNTADATGNGFNGTLINGPTWQVPSTSILATSAATLLWSPGGQTTNPITAATSGTYSAVVTISGCQSASASSSVVLGVTASSNQTICSGTSPANLTLTGTAATIQWQSSTDNVNFTNIGGATSATLSSAQMGNLNATTYYRAYATSAVCAPSYSNTVTITVNTTPSFTSTTGASRCGTGTVTLQAATAAGTINWYAALTGGASLGTGTSFNTPSIAATTTYYADVTNNGCTSSPRTAVVATVNAIPTFSSTTGASICGTGTATLQAATAAGTINWYAALTGGASLGTGTSYTTPSIATTTTYYVDVTNNGCTSSPRTAVVATVNAIPSVATNAALGITIDILTVAGGGGAGFARGGGGGAGGYLYNTNVSYAGGTSTPITVGTGGSAGYDNAGTGVHATSGTNSSFGSTYIAIGGGGGGSYGGGPQNGYNGGSGGGGANQSSAANTGYGGSGTAGQGNAGGNSRCGGGGEVSGGGGGGAGGNGTHGTSNGCGSAANRPYNPGNGGNGLQNSISGSAVWYSGGGGGGGLGPSNNLQGTNGLGGGQASYGGGGQCKLNANNWVTEGGGPGIVIVRYAGTPVATGGTITQVGGFTIHTFTSNGTFALAGGASASVPNVTSCGAAAVTFTGTVNAGFTLDWYDAANGGNLLSQGTSTYTTPVISTTTTYYVAVRNTTTGCVSATRTAVTATVNIASFTSTTGASICGTGTATLQAATAAGTINWYAALTGGASLGTGTSYTTPSIAATTTYYADVTNNGCTSSPRTAVVATVNAIPTITSTTGASICVSGTGTLQAATAAGTINWYAALTGGASLGTGTSYTTPSIATTTTYYADVTNNGCTSSPRTSIVATVIPSSTASSSQTVCPGLLPSAITLTNYGGTIQWQTSNDNVTFTNIAGQTSATLPANAIGIMAGTKYIRAMVTNGACVTPSNVVTLSPANVNVLTPLTASSYVWNGQSSSDWGTLSNWYSYNGTSLVPAATLPGSTANTIIPANTGCILTQPTLSSGAIIINSLVLETGSQFTQSGGTLLLYTNFVKNGSLISTGGLMNFYGPTSATISGSGAVQFTKMRVNKLAGATLTLQIPVTVSDSLTMILGNIYTTTNNLLTLGLNSASPGKLAYTSGTVVGPLKRFFANAAVSGLAGRFPVGTATYNRYAQFSFASSPGVDQSLTVNYASGAPLSGGNILYNGLPLWASNSLMQNYSADGYWNVIPTNNDYTSTINTAPYEVTLYANNLTGMQTPQVCRIIKSAGSNTAAQNHVAWSACGTHTAIAGGANPLAFLISSTASQGFSWFNIGTPNSQALPVEFAGMTTTCEEEVISIRWSTESEYNNDYFRIEKSTDGSAWDILGYVDAVGNSSILNGYEYLDVEYRSNTYYRLYQVDQDGSEELLSTMYSDCNVAADEIASFPNPSDESFSIFWKQFNTSGDGTITIRDINGKTMHHETVALSLGANLFMIKAPLAPGVYIIELMDDNYERSLIKHVVK